METKKWIKKGGNSGIDGHYHDPEEDSSKLENKKKIEMNPNAIPFTPPIEQPKMKANNTNQPIVSPSLHQNPSAYICIVCPLEYFQPREVLEHMLREHNLVIADVDVIAELQTYLKFWHNKVYGVPLSEYCTTINTQISPGAPIRNYFLLSDIHPEDQRIRRELQKNRLNNAIELQQYERYSADFHRKCLFCKMFFEDRKSYFAHMFESHGLNIGLPDNLVNINGFLDLLESKIKDNVCIYCERIFKDYSTLKLHMRKKKHFKINGRNKEYDQFYIINYLEEGRTWEQILSESDAETEEGEVYNETWDDWEEDELESVYCLFCDLTFPSTEECFIHIKEIHHFDFKEVSDRWGLDFYSRVRLINYIRHQTRAKRCTLCDVQFATLGDLLFHVEKQKHYGIKKDAEFFSDNAYLKPILENDALLLTLEDDDEDKKDLLEETRKELEELTPNPAVLQLLVASSEDEE